MLRNHELGDEAFMNRYGLPFPSANGAGIEVPVFQDTLWRGLQGRH